MCGRAESRDSGPVMRIVGVLVKASPYAFSSILAVYLGAMAVGSAATRRWVRRRGAGGALQTGRFVSFDGRPHNDLLVSICNLMGMSDTSFGDPELCTGALPL